VLRHPSQHGIDEAGIASAVSIGLCQPYAQVDRGVVGNVEKKDLRSADQKHAFGAWRVVGTSAFEQTAQQMPQRAEPAQNGCDEPAHERAVSIRESDQSGVGLLAIELFVEGSAATQHGIEDVDCDPPRGQSWNVLRAEACARHHWSFEAWSARRCRRGFASISFGVNDKKSDTGATLTGAMNDKQECKR
jgi:hypothetical protein